MGLVAWELYHIDCYRQWPELPEIVIKSPPKTQRSLGWETASTPIHSANATTTACSHVFGIPELAEEIFLLLNQSELLSSAQQVCRQWCVIITTSRAIREHLFFDSISDIRPWLVKTSRFPVMSTEQPHFWAEDEGLVVSRVIIENPFMPLLSIETPWSEPFARAEASWRRMLITQPGLSQISRHTNDNAPWLHEDIVSEGMSMGKSAEGGAIHKIGGWSAWKACDNPQQLTALKAEMRLSRSRLQELHEWTGGDGLPEYEVWEEKTGESLQLDL